jgi:hypothetical protein
MSNKKIAASARKLAKKRYVFCMDEEGNITKRYLPHLKENLYYSKANPSKNQEASIISEQWIINMRNNSE